MHYIQMTFTIMSQNDPFSSHSHIASTGYPRYFCRANNNTMTNEAQIKDRIANWVKAIQEKDWEGIMAWHHKDIVMYDVPPPFQSIGMEKSDLLVSRVVTAIKRYLYPQINWNNRLTGIKGQRGTGKTTLLLQRLHELGKSPLKPPISLWMIFTLPRIS
jgi:hypothetical protein